MSTLSWPTRKQVLRGPCRPAVPATALFFAALLALSPGCGPAGSPAPPEASREADAGPYHILVSNDDGIGSPGIQLLADALREVGEVTVVAPCGQQSGSSMSIRLGVELRLTPVGEGDEPWGHCVDATPAGAVLLAIESLAPEGGFDLVVSGINAGANVGDVGHMSGTVGAAMMGAYYGVPAVASSLDSRNMDFRYAAAFTARFVAELRRQPPLPGVVLSVNFPAETEDEIAGVALGRMGGSAVRFGYEEVEPEDGMRVFLPRFVPAETQPPGSDSEAFATGMITVTPLRFDWTDEEALLALEAWELDHRLGGPPGS